MLRLAFTIAAVAAGLYVLDRALLGAERRGWIYYRTKRGSHSSVGSAFLEVQALMEPDKRHVLDVREIEERREQEPDDRGPTPGPAGARRPPR